MARYLVIEPGVPCDSSDSDYFAELVQGIAGLGNETVLFLVQNGVLPARKGSKHNEVLAKLVKDKVQVLADGFSLRERAARNVANGMKLAHVDRLVELLLEPGIRTIWH
jgi:hypothetical protein